MKGYISNLIVAIGLRFYTGYPMQIELLCSLQNRAAAAQNGHGGALATAHRSWAWVALWHAVFNGAEP
jgi:hypothetical protein